MRFSRALTVPIVVLLLGAMAACGGQEGGDGVASLSGNSTNGNEDQTEISDAERGRLFAQCMRDNGVEDFPDPDPDGGVRITRDQFGDRDQTRAAMEACREYSPMRDRGQELDPAQQAQMLEWAQCMRDNGIDIPDPDPNSGGFLFGGPGGGQGIDPGDPDFQAAMEACQDKMTFRGPGGQRGNG